MSEDQAHRLREYVRQTMPNAWTQPIVIDPDVQPVYPDFRVKIGIRDGHVVEVDYLDALTSGALSTPPTVEQVKQYLLDAVKFLEGK